MDTLRDNLVDLILKANDAVEAVLEEAGSLEYTYKDLCSIEADYMITNGVTVQKWIPVTERVPDLIPCNAGTAYSEAVIVWTEGKKAMVAVWNGKYFLCAEEYWDAWGEKITHWMPLPTPPKEE